MKVLAERWNRFWFEPTTATHLAFGRIVFYAFFAYLNLGLDSGAWADFSTIIWEPVSFFAWIDVPVASAAALDALDVALIVSAVFCSLGLASRVSLPVCALLALYVLGLPNNFGKVNHGWNVSIVVLCFFAFSRAGDKWSIDALLRRRLGKSAPPVLSGEYTWPIRVVWLVIVAMYFSAGIAKLTKTGLDWALSDNLRLLLVRHHYSHHPPTDLGLFVVQHEWLARALAVGSLAAEALCPVAFVHRWARYAVGIALCGMQLGIWLMMGVLFQATLACFFIFWPPWGPMLDRLIAGFRLRTPIGAAASS